jgi:hypothetical protein
MKVGYEVDENERLITLCPHGDKIETTEQITTVGSIFCVLCPNNTEHNRVGKYVMCNLEVSE